MRNKELPFWILTISVFIVLIVPELVKDGMFMDGLLYTTVSKNLADGFGCFWFPRYTETFHLPFFHEQPPLVFGIQALFFKIFGNSIYVERFYSLLTASITFFLITILWKEIFYSKKKLKQMSWLPAFLWVIIPVCFWAYSNNIQENTMGIFTLSSTIIILKALRINKYRIIYLMLGGVFIFLASLSKGFPGLFPLSIIIIHQLIFKKLSFSKTILYSLILVAVTVIIYLIILINDNAYLSLTTYLNERVLNSINSVSNVNSRLYLLFRLFTEMIPVLILCLIILLIGKYKSIKTKISSNKKMIFFFLLIGFSASLPLLITLEQRGFYLVTSLPFFAIAFAIIIAPTLVKLINQMNEISSFTKTANIITVLILVFVLTFSTLQIGKYSRDKQILQDIYLIGTKIPTGETISTEPDIWHKYNVHSYFMRHFKISLTTGFNTEYFITNKNYKIHSDDYKKIVLETEMFDLYKKE